MRCLLTFKRCKFSIKCYSHHQKRGADAYFLHLISLLMAAITTIISIILSIIYIYFFFLNLFLLCLCS